MYTLYKMTSPSDKCYVGVTKDYPRRLKQHLRSTYPIGRALQKYGPDNFYVEFEYFDNVYEALGREAELVDEEAIESGKFYNVVPGGMPNPLLTGENPMYDQEILALFETPVIIEDVEYKSLRFAATILGLSPSTVHYRLNNEKMDGWSYAQKELPETSYDCGWEDSLSY